MSSSDRPPGVPPAVREFSFPELEPDASGEPQDYVFAPFGDSDTRAAPEALEDWEQRARRLLEEAQERRQHLEREAYEQGFRQGQLDGQEVGRRGLAEVTQRLAALTESLAALASRLYRQREEELVALCLLIARRVLGRELTTSPEAIRTLLEQSFQMITRHEGLKLHLHPQDLEIVATGSRETWPPGVELVADGTLTPGGFRLETAWGEVDGTVETRFQRVAEAVQRVLEEGHADQTD